MPKKRTHEEFVEIVENIVGDEYTVIGQYINNMTKVEMRHNSDNCNNHVYPVTPNKFVNIGRRCPECFGSKKKTTESFKKELYEKFGDSYTLISEYKNTNEKVDIRHNCEKCNNYIWSVRACDIINKPFECPKCKGVARKTHKEFVEEVKNLVGDEYEFLEEYTNNKALIKVRHNNEGCNNHVYPVSPNRFLSGDRCPRCKESRGEKRISEYLIKNNISHETQVTFPDCKYINNVSFDFKIFLNDNTFILLEYDGKQHFFPTFHDEKEFNKQVKRDNFKNDYCKEKNIKLFRISYEEFDDIETILDELLKA